MQNYGTVMATFEGPTTRKFSFVINKEAHVRRGQFVQIDIPDGKLIGRVADIKKMNRYFCNPESIPAPEAKPLHEIYPTSEWEYLVADVVAQGVWTGNSFQDSLMPPSPGTTVSEPQTEILESLFGLDRKGLHIGKLTHHSLDIKLNLTKLLQKHLAILALSGAGKSYLVGVLIEELLKRSPESGKIATVIVDPHGEYTTFAKDPKFSASTKVFDVSDIQISLKSILQRAESLLELTSPQSRVLHKIMSGLKGSFSIGDLLVAIETSDTNNTTKEVLMSVVTHLGRSGLFGLEDRPKLDELAQPGQLSVIDLSSTIDMRKKQLVVEHIARELFDSRRKERIPPFLLIIEEAHQFAPERAKSTQAVSKGILQTIAREGRKFHASLCLVSQRPKHLSTTILSQCNTNIILRITNPYDLDHIGQSSEGISKDVLESISSLPVGTGLIVGEGVNSPIFVKVRKRESKSSEKGKPLEQAAQEWAQKTAKKKEDAQAFM